MLNNDFWPNDRMTEWPSDWVAEWQSDRVTEWPSDQVTEWLSDQLTGSFADDWPYGIFAAATCCGCPWWSWPPGWRRRGGRGRGRRGPAPGSGTSCARPTAGSSPAPGPPPSPPPPAGFLVELSTKFRGIFHHILRRCLLASNSNERSCLNPSL